MKKGRTLFIWDIHGCFNELKLLIKKLKLTSEDKVYFTWDLINKGPKSYKVVKYMYKHRDKFNVVLWNHDYEFLNYIAWKKVNDKLKHLNKKFEKLHKKLKEKPELLKYLKKLPLYIEEKKFILVHGWILPWKSLEKHTAEELCYIRMYKWKPWHEYYTWDKKVIYGHWAVAWLNISSSAFLNLNCNPSVYVAGILLIKSSVVL